MITLATKITLLRILLVPIVVILLYFPCKITCFLAALAFIAAALTDWFDGHIARSRHLVTNMGKFLDPLADKVLICSVLIMLVNLGWAPAWVVLIIVCRELIITGLRAIAIDEGIVMAADRYGKLKTVLQICAIIPLILNYPFFGIKLSPVFGAAAMSLSSFCVVTNALRLNFFRLFDSSHQKRKARKEIRPYSEGSQALTESHGASCGLSPEKETLLVEGMMCGHCEAHVKEALEKVDGVAEALCDHEKGTAEILVNGPVDESALKAAVEGAGYTFKGIAAPAPESASGEETILVSGMMCGHCEAHVKEALEKIDGVREATADHKKGQVVLKLSAPVAESALKAAVEGAGYTFKGVAEDPAASLQGHAEILVGGMMCGNCEKHVKEALEKVHGVKEAKADHRTGRVSLTFSSLVKEYSLARAVQAAGYTYKGLSDSSSAPSPGQSVLLVDGMMCGSCERHVKEALEKVDGIDEASPDHTTGRVALKLSAPVFRRDLEKAVKDAGYTLRGIEK